jgi:hypothetical protein
MYVRIGPYVNWFGPYQLAELLRYFGVSEERCDKLGEWLNSIPSVQRFFEWLGRLRQRRVVVKIHPYDVWNMNDTLGLIILPMLKMLRETTHGYSMVDDEDVPMELRSTAAPPLLEERINCGYPDENGERRWDWVLGEMIWSFEQLADSAEDQFFAAGKAFDRAAYNAWYARKRRGLALFGKYYGALWD